MSNRHPDHPVSRAGAKSKWLFFFGFLTFFAILDSLHDYIARRGEGSPVSPLSELMGGLFYWGPCIAMVPLIIALDRRVPLSFKRAGPLAIHALAGLVFTYFNILIEALWELAPVLNYRAHFFYLLKYDFALLYGFYWLIVVSIYVLRHYEELAEREVRASQLELALGEARLRALQAQLNPHFFFNTLQAISVMALAGERNGVVEMLNRLSSLLRVSFDKHRPQQLPLAAELEFLQGYLDIQQLCFEHRLVIQNEVKPDTLMAYVPTMLLQPLVENAIEHGVAVKPGRGLIRIAASRRGDDLLLEIADSGPGFQASQPYRSGVGLSATESRLKLLFGANHSIEYGASELGGASVKIRIPFLLSAAHALAVPSRELAA